MNQQLSTISPSSTSLQSHLPRDDEALRLTAWCLSGSTRTVSGKLALMNWPNDAQRAVLQARHRQLVAHMGKADYSTIATAVTALIGCYRNALKPGEEVKPVVGKYVKELQGLPTWACVRACDAIRNNQYADCITFLPSTIRLREIASSYCEPMRRQGTEIFEVLHADRMPEPVTDEMRARVGEKMRKLSQHLAGVRDPIPPRVTPGSHVREIAEASRARQSVPRSPEAEA